MKIFLVVAVISWHLIASAEITKQSLDKALQIENCGLSGTIEDRIKDCSKLPRSAVKTKAGIEWNLVGKLYLGMDYYGSYYTHVWRDSRTGLVWGDVLLIKEYIYFLQVSGMHNEFIILDSKYNVVKEIYCNSEIGIKSYLGISGKQFGLPSAEEIDQAIKNGMNEVVRNKDDIWTKDIDLDDNNYAYVYYVYNNEFELNRRNYKRPSSICVGRD